jgi:predicted nucleic acid-binding protein
MLPIDEKDMVFLATAMALKEAIIWSDDRDFKRQNQVPVKTTQEMLKDRE